MEEVSETIGQERKWKPITEVQRRVLGVLVEKAKTTPEQYPLTLNSVTTACNQKSNRAPQMNLDGEDVQIALEELRAEGAVVEVQSGGRTAKFKHLAYDWLGVDKVELAVIAELLLRGAQTVGELRGRAARMEAIADLGALQPILQSLRDKGLLFDLTPVGRGQVVSHNLYEDYELKALRDQFAGGAPPPPKVAVSSASAPPQEDLESLKQEIADLRARVERMESRLA